MRMVITFLQDDSWPAWARVRRPLPWLVAILLFAAALRVYGINNFSPPGLEHDEVANWLIDRAILEGRLAIYFQDAYGHEAGFHYLQAAFVGLLGDHALALRLPAAYVGLLVVAVHYALVSRLLGRTTALWSTMLLALLFWPVFYSRLGLRAISLPLISGLALCAWWRAWLGTKPPAARPAGWFVMAGVLAGMAMYTYMAARALPIFFLLFTAYLLLFHRPRFRQNWRGIAAFWLLFLVVALPLILYLLANPGAEFRISEVDAPLRALLAGEWQPVAHNAWRIVRMFGLAGDPLWRQNVAGRPVFDPLTALLFYAGLPLALLRLRDERYAFLLIWLLAAAVPSLVTTDAPSSIRMINALLVITVFPVLVINILTRLSPFSPRLSTVFGYLLGFVWVMAHIWGTGTAVFHRWPANEEVQFVWQAALTDIAAYLDASVEDTPVAIGGWSPATMDPSTLFLSMRRQDLEVRFFGSDSTAAPVSTIILPASAEGTRLLRPAIREVAPAIEEWLQRQGASSQEMGTFVAYDVPPVEGSEAVEQVIGAGELALLDYVLPEESTSCAEDECAVLTVWQVMVPKAEPRRFFLHAVDAQGTLLAQHDGLDAPSPQWQVGDLVIQAHLLPPVGDDNYDLKLGVYDPQTGQRLLTEEGMDATQLRWP
jgi:4-amino-4-deoxy-L-arabinose transferase-like glycosyltransferase